MPYWSWLYQYAVGGTVFFAAILLLLRSKAIRWDRPAVTSFQFLLIGPAWLLSFVYRRLGISY